MKTLCKAALLLAAVSLAAPAAAQKIYLNPSDQNHNPVAGGGVESTYALINANLAKKKLDTLGGFITRVDQDFYNAPSNANSWGASIFVSIHSNALATPNRGHGTCTLYKSTGGKTLADKVQRGLLSKLPYENDGLVYRDNLHVLNATAMYAALTEVVFHDCSTTSGVLGHPPSESAFLKSSSGQDKIGAGLCQGVASYYGRACTVAPPPPSQGYIKGVVYKNGDLTQHIAGATLKLNTGATLTYDGGTGWSFTVAPGTYTVTASASGYQTASKTVTVTAGATSWSSIELKPVVVVTKGAIIGVVCKDAVSSTCTKIANATVQLNTGAKVTYDGVNAWRFDVAPGTYTVMVSASGYQTLTKTGVVVTASGTTWASAALVANPVTPTTGGITGNVTRSDTGARIAASIEVNPGGKTASCTASANWTVTGLSAGTYTVTASAAGFQETTKTVAVTAGNTATLDLALAPAPVAKGWLRGVVYRNPNEADEVSGATVKLNSGQQTTFTAGTEWAFELPVGSYQITATAPGFDTVTVPAIVADGEETFVALGLESLEGPGAKGVLRGFVYADPDPSKRIAATIALDTGDLLEYDGQNDWSLEVPAGSYTVTASADGYIASEVDVEVAAGGTAAVEVGLRVDLGGVEIVGEDGCGCSHPGVALPMLVPLVGLAAAYRRRRRPR